MAQICDLGLYNYFIIYDKYSKLARLTKLTKEQINIIYPLSRAFNPRREILNLYYGYYDEIDKYTNNDINLLPCFAVRFIYLFNNKILEPIKYLESRGFNFNVDEYYLKAASAGSIKIMKYLEFLGVNINIRQSYTKKNAFLEAPSKLKVLRYIESCGINIHCKDNYGYNAYIKHIKKIKIIKYLYSLELNIHYIIYNEKVNLYNYAAMYSNIKILKFLEHCGIFIHLFNNRNDNSFIYALHNSNRVIKYIKSRGINIYIKDCDGVSQYKKKNQNKKLEKSLLISVLYICSKTKYLLCYI
jgi:hypothetical protein